jgi:apolipoprotein N-acyltransferase
MSAAFPPAGVWPLAFVALVPFLLVVRTASVGRAAVLGAVFGVAFFGAHLYWIMRFGQGAWTALTLMLTAWMVVFAVLARTVTRERTPWRNAFALAALWTVIEWLRGMWPLGGFTWGSLGVSQVDDRLLLPLASVAGVWGITFVVAAVNALVLEAVVGGGAARARVTRIGVAGLMVAAPALIPFPVATGAPVDVASLQVDVRVPPEVSRDDGDIIVARRHVELHRQLEEGPRPDLILWGEGALDPAAATDGATAREVANVVAGVGAPTVIGAVLNDPDGSEHTSVLVYDGGADVVDRYDKVHLVPFGEYVPWRDRLSWFKALEQIPVDRVPGGEIATVALDDVPRFGTPICFENAFPALPRRFVQDGATFLVVPVNNASYGFTAASEQHLQMSRIRAVETGRWVVNAAVSGVSAFIDTQGAVQSRQELFETGVLRASIPTSTAQTLYVRAGDWVPWLSIGLLLGLLAAPRRRTARRPVPEPLPPTARTLVILPTYDERPTIVDVLSGVLARPEQVDVLVVDDSSPDGTADLVREIAAGQPRVRLVERPAKSGLGSAYLEGFHLALAEDYDLVVEMDSDLSHDPAELSRLLEAAERHHLAIGSRYVPGGSVTNWSRARVALSRGGNTYARLMLGVPVHDATSGYRVYRRDALSAVIGRPFASDGYGFQIELVLRADRMGLHIGEVPITFREREHGQSKISRRIVAEALWLVTRWGLVLRMGREPV